MKNNKSVIIGILYILLSAFFFAVSSSFGKIVTMNSSMSGIVNSFSRFLLGTIVMFIFMVITKKSFKINRFKHIFTRSAFNSISIMLFSLGFQYTTITNANMLQMTYPVFVLILAPIIYNEKIAKKSYLYLGIIMTGCYLVAFPNFASINIGDVYSVLSSIAAAISILSLKEASKYDETNVIIFYVMLIATFINFPFVIRDLFIPDTKILFNILLSALTGVLGQVFITMGYKYVDNATGAMVSASRILIAAVLGVVLFSDTLNLRVILGGIIIILALIGVSGYFDNRSR